MWNLLLALTNFTVYYPIITALAFEDAVTAIIIAFAASMSVVSHFFESHKHLMWGFGCSPHASYLLNRLDVLGVIVVIGRMLWLWSISGTGLSIITDDPLQVLLLLLAVVCNLLSEKDQGRSYYVPLHCIWYVSIFLLMNSFLGSTH